MNRLSQNDVEYLQDMVSRGELSVQEANVELVLSARVRLVEGRMPKDVRAALNAAVAAGRLGHLKKDGYLPECYYHPNFDYLARAERNEAAKRKVAAIAKIIR